MGMTLGEMAQMFNAENKIGCDLHVIQMQGWRRSYWSDQTGLPRVNPSPNLRSLAENVLYPGLEILQAGGVSVGRGTSQPFGLVGAPWIRAAEFAVELNRRAIAGALFEPTQFTPVPGMYKGELCEGVKVELSDRDALKPLQMGIEIAGALAKLYPGKFQAAKLIELVGNSATVGQLASGDAPSAIAASWDKDLEAFRRIRAKYLLYE
jgi:uncharacterized protein YbbC (DUF1343 family)